MVLKKFISLAIIIFASAEMTVIAHAENIPFLKTEHLSGQTASISYDSGTYTNTGLIGVLLNDKQIPVEIKTVPLESQGRTSIEFNRKINDYTLRLFLWDNEMTPLTTANTHNALNVKFTGSYTELTNDKSIIYSVTDNENTPMTLFFNNTISDITFAFDIKIESITADGAIVGMIPFSNNVRGRGVGFCRDEGDSCLIPYTTAVDTPFEYTSADFYNKWIHIELEFHGGNVMATYSDTDTNTVYVDRQEVPIINGVGTEEHPINRLDFGIAFTGTLNPQPAKSIFYIKNFDISRY